MKKFRYSDNRVAGSTMTVSELRKELQKYPGNMPVIATWEGVSAYVKADNFTTDVVGKGKKADAETCLIIDAEDY